MIAKFLQKAYGHGSGKEAREFYDKWAATYTQEITENGYVTPMRCAEALAGFASDFSTPVLDIGCGTGLGGAALKNERFTVIDGWDPSLNMLEEAEASGVYRTVTQIDPAAPFTAPPGTYANAFASGVFSPGLAPPAGLDQVLKFLPKGGHLVFSLNDHAIEDGSHMGRLRDIIDGGAAHLMFKEYGDHLPGTNLKSWVYVLQKR